MLLALNSLQSLSDKDKTLSASPLDKDSKLPVNRFSHSSPSSKVLKIMTAIHQFFFFSPLPSKILKQDGANRNSGEIIKICRSLSSSLPSSGTFYPYLACHLLSTPTRLNSLRARSQIRLCTLYYVHRITVLHNCQMNCFSLFLMAAHQLSNGIYNFKMSSSTDLRPLCRCCLRFL